MKTYRKLYPELTSFQNIYWAYRAARKGKRGKVSVAEFEQIQEEELLCLQEELRNFTYTPGAYHSFFIHDPKKRFISAAPFRDRIVHHALCQVIEPIWERRFIFDSYANRKGKGTHKALDRAQQFSRSYQYFIQCDVKQFFPSIDHKVLMTELKSHIADQGVLWLCNQILLSGVGVLSDEYSMVYYPGDDLLAVLRPRGLPIGNLTSQFWANVYLNCFDHFIKRELHCPAYVRYVDDFLLFADNKSLLHSWKAEIIERMARLRLSIHENTAQVSPCSTGIPFLGFRIYPTHRRLKRRKVVHIRRKFKALLTEARNKPEQTPALKSSIKGWINHARYGDTWGLRRKILNFSIPPG